MTEQKPCALAGTLSPMAGASKCLGWQRAATEIEASLPFHIHGIERRFTHV